MTHPVLTSGRVAVVTGAAMGIGLAACRRFAALGMRVCMADVLADELQSARGEVATLAPGGERDVLAVPTDAARREDVEALREAVHATFGDVGLLMNNAATRVGGGALERLRGLAGRHERELLGRGAWRVRVRPATGDPQACHLSSGRPSMGPLTTPRIAPHGVRAGAGTERNTAA